MDKVGHLIEQRRHELQKILKPVFGEDSNNAAEMMLRALCREFDDLVGEDEYHRFLSALARLPTDSKAKPWINGGQHVDGPPFRPSFFEGGVRYLSTRVFDTKDAANDYSQDFL